MERGKHFLTNHQARVYLDAIAEVSGKYGFEARLAACRIAVLDPQSPTG